MSCSIIMSRLGGMWFYTFFVIPKEVSWGWVVHDLSSWRQGKKFFNEKLSINKELRRR